MTRADRDSGQVTVWEYDDAFTLTDMTPTDLVLPPERRNLAGSANVASSMVVISKATGGAMEDVDYATGSHIATYPMPNSEAAAAGYSRGAASPGTTSSRVLSGTSNNLYTVTPLHEADVWWAGATYNDSVTGHETTIGPLTQITRVKGTSVILAVGGIPASADSVRFYAGASPTIPARTSMFLQSVPATPFGPTDPRADVITALRSNDTDGLHPNPPATGTLTAVLAPHVFKSGDGSTLFDGSYTALEAGGGGGTSVYGGINIDCGGAVDNGLDIDCGGA